MIDYYAVIVDVCRYREANLAYEFADKLQAAYTPFNTQAFLNECFKLEGGDYEA